MLDFARVSLNITLLNPVQEGTDCSCDPANLESIHAKSVRSPTLKSSDPGSYQDKLMSFENKGPGRTALTGASFIHAAHLALIMTSLCSSSSCSFAFVLLFKQSFVSHGMSLSHQAFLLSGLCCQRQTEQSCRALSW